MFHIEDIYRWGFKPNQMFYFEINEENDLGEHLQLICGLVCLSILILGLNSSPGTGTLEFDTVEGKVLSDLLTDYAMAFLKEREREVHYKICVLSMASVFFFNLNNPVYCT